MATATLTSSVLSLLGFAILVPLVAITNRTCLYKICRRILQGISLKLIKNKPLLFRYKDKSTIKALDELLELITQTSLLLKSCYESPKKQPLHTFQVYAYVDDCRQRTLSYFKELKANKKEKPLGIPYERENNLLRGSCYFCSQPILLPFWGKATVYTQENKLHVPSCNICQEALENSHKVNTLCFVENEKKLHWSECKSYQPQIEYWEINQQKKTKPVLKKHGSLLKLVHSRNAHNPPKKGI